MKNKEFILRHKNIDVALLQISDDGEMHNAHVLQPAYVPFIPGNDEKCIYRWWKERAIPEGRDRLSELLGKYGCQSASEFLLKNLGLSLTDTYWICPFDYRRLKWEDVNLFEHGLDSQHFHESEERVHYSDSPDAALGGTLDKESVKLQDGWYLQKRFNPKYPDAQQNINELFVSEIHRRQGFREYTPYTVIRDKHGVCEFSRCKYFTSQNLELISAYDLTGGYKSGDYSGTWELEKYVTACVDGGLDQDYVSEFMDYMISIDYVTSNSDRHWHNFGVLRDPDSLKLKSMAPIYDHGNCMFFDSPYALNRASLVRMENTGIEKREIDRLAFIHNRKIVKADLLPSPKEVQEFYCKYGLNEERAIQISETYSLKLDLYMEFQYGLEVSYAREMEKYIDGTPYKDQNMNKKYFRAHPEDAAMK